MKAKSENCDDALVSRFVDGVLSEPEHSELARHLDDCEMCATKIAQAAADDGWWQKASDSLKDGPFELEALSATSDNSLPVSDVSIRNVLDQLAPTDDPRMLGRLGSYEIAGVVGTGGMGIVLKAFDAALDRFVAIKALSPHLASSGAARTRFSREAKAAAAVVHDNVSEIYGVDEVNGLPYLVMPYVRGASLRQRLEKTGPMTLEQVLRIAMQAASGLAAAHAQGLVHRDIKPANILLSEGIERVQITDFGLARAADDASLTRTGIIAGTPQFMSPEQARGDAIDHRSDLFSLGSVMYMMATGRPPFRAESSYGVLRRITDTQPRPIREINPLVPTWLCDVIGKLHAKNADDRFQSADEVSDLLSKCLAHVQQPDTNALPIEVEAPRLRKCVIAFATITTLCAMAATFAVVGWGSNEPSALPSPQHSAAESKSAKKDSDVMDESDLDWNAVDVDLRVLTTETKELEDRSLSIFEGE